MALGVLDRIKMMESGGDINARSTTSSAQGLYGFTDAAFDQVVQDNPDLANVTKDQWASDPNLQKVFAERFADFQKGVLQKQGFEPNPVNLYANWHFGSGGGPKFLNSSADTPMEAILDPNAIKANPHLQGKTQGEVMQWISQKMGAEGNNMNTNLPLTMAQMKNLTPEVFNQLSALVDDPEISPELAQAISAKRQKSIQALPLAMGAMLSGDKGIRDIGQGLYQQGQNARNLVPVGDEGFVDPESGQILVNPEGLENRQLALADMAGDVSGKLAGVGGNMALAGATLENTQWYQRNKLNLEKLGVDIRNVKNQMELFQLLSDPEMIHRMKMNGIDPNELGVGGANTPDTGAQPGAQPNKALPLATGSQEPTAGQTNPNTPTAPSGGQKSSALPRATNQSQPKVFKEVPGAETYGISPETGQPTVVKNGVYYENKPELGGFVMVDGPSFDNPARQKARAEAGLKQGELADRQTWEAKKAKDPLSPFATYDDYVKNVGSVRAEAQSLLTEMQSALLNDRETNQKLQRFKELNKTTSTGSTLQKLTDGTMTGKLLNPGAEELMALSADLKASSVPEGQGAVSDAERRLFGDAVPGAQYQQATNNSLIEMSLMRNQFREDRARMLQQFFEERGHLNGAVPYVEKQLEEKYLNDPNYQRLKALMPGTNTGDVSDQDDSGFEIISIEE